MSYQKATKMIRIILLLLLNSSFHSSGSGSSCPHTAELKQWQPINHEEKMVLSEWIGQNKDFHLLYRASTDGCSHTVFHTKCDNVGPTITVAYGTSGYVFGAYTSMSWNQLKQYINDPGCFIFGLRTPQGQQQKKLPILNGRIYGVNSVGPYFTDNVYGHEILSLMNQQPALSTNGVFKPYCKLNIETGAVSRGTCTNQLLFGGTTEFYDIEVYHVKESELLPNEEEWRKLGAGFEWVPQPLKDEIRRHTPKEALKVDNTNILLLGVAGSGKSSFFNTVNSAFRGHVTSQALVGTGSHSITTKVRQRHTWSKLRQYKVRAGKDSLKLHIWDTMGIEKDGGLIYYDVPYILDGNIPDHFQFNPAVGITCNQQDFKIEPKLKDKVHVVAIVLDAPSVSSLEPTTQDKMKALVSMALHRGIPCAVLLTKIDSVCPFVAKDVKKVFRSKKILDLVNQVSELTGVARGHVLPVQNYEVQIDTEEGIDTLALLTLRQILRFAEDFYYEQLDVMGE